MLIRRVSIATGAEREMEIPVTESQLESWLNGELIQNAMPNLTLDEREFIMTGMTQADWDDMCADEE